MLLTSACTNMFSSAAACSQHSLQYRWLSATSNCYSS